MGDLRYESFTVPGAAGTKDEASQEFVRALDMGFVEAERGEELEVVQLDRFRDAGTLLSAVYDDDQDPRALAAGRPVATFGDFDGTLCVAPGVVVPTRMVTEVSVRGTHRRRGILRKLMTSCLTRSSEQGYALAALTATEDSIYGRFGFGRAALSTSVTVEVTQGLRLRPEVRAAIDAAGLRTFTPSRESFPTMYDAAYAAFQRATPGQTGTTAAFRGRARGEENPWAVKGQTENWRPLVVVDATGEVRGYALAGTVDWGAKGARTMKIADIGADSTLAEIALWEALGSTDLVERLSWNEAPTDFALPAALLHPRDVVFTGRADHLWIRIVDLPTAFGARGLAVDGTLHLSVTDPLGLVEGDWVVTTNGGVTEVTPAAEAGTAVGHQESASLRLDAEALAELYLGTVDPGTLVQLGRAEAAAEDVAALKRMFAVERAPRNSYTF
ncbi:MAG: GNAT family N-acetyltransferase [Galactobacter sp.]